MKSNRMHEVIVVPAKGSKAAPAGSRGRPATSGPEVKAGAEAKRPGNAVGRALHRAAVSPRAWAAITCLLLGISGAVRYWRDAQFYSIENSSKECPFPLADVPKVLGTWRMLEGSEKQFDADTAQIAGATDHFVRDYTDERTGNTVSVLVLYGLAQHVVYHTAEVCSPASGWDAARPPEDHDLKIPDVAKLARYRGSLFSKKLAGFSEYSEVIYSFRHAGDWVPDAQARSKTFRQHPGCFKIQLQRSVDEFDIESSPSLSLLQELIAQIENRLKRKADEAKAKAVQGPQSGAGKKAG
jgi:Protein of unknown function (DUF3485)